MLKYGTAGFRMNSKLLISYSEKIGLSLVYLLMKSPRLNNFLGIMITASHNNQEDNGIKIVDQWGSMLNSDEEDILEEVVNNKTTLESIDITKEITFYFGKDTRSSCDKIIDYIIKGAKKSNLNINYKLWGEITTPVLHHISSKYLYINGNELNQYCNIIKNVKLSYFPYIDCAGGVGAKVLQKLNHPNLRLISVPENSILNEGCGSEFILHNENKIADADIWKNNDIRRGDYGCSLDGDGDRLIFWYIDESDKLQILDGDYQMVLWCLYLKQIGKQVIAVTTPYCNGAAIEYLKQQNIEVKFTPTGIKNLHLEAIKHEYSVYFENNGHGTGHFSHNIFLKSSSQPLICNQLIGDGIYNIFTTFQILQELNINIMVWKKLYNKIPVKQFSIPKDKIPNIVTNKLGDKIIEPIVIQNTFDKLSNEFNGRVFARPSGTEPIIRIYCESKKI